MTNTNVAATKPTLLRAWWMNKNLRLDLAMSSIIMILNIEAMFYMRTHKVVPLDLGSSGLLPLFVPFYILFSLISCICWVSGITDVNFCEGGYACGLVSHIFGLCVFVNLLYHISPQLALYVGINLGLCLLWLVAIMSGPYLWYGVQAVRGWWKFVNQPGRAKIN
ncbi:unnamed protein product [Arabis nemorensis]|uniref:Uncharacterized protein n=1 Tax=Arabis nemorensis TaxID=586526 RepID=A0A565BH98_9BRAS|nr:unnamed protein product [Arabis nemorensis]